MKQPDHIHTGGDGRGQRDVFLDGRLIDQVVYADTKRGIVRVTDSPPRLDKWGKRILTRTMKGRVAVFPKKS